MHFCQYISSAIRIVMVTGDNESISLGTAVPYSVRSEPTRSTLRLEDVFFCKSKKNMYVPLNCLSQDIPSTEYK